MDSKDGDVLFLDEIHTIKKDLMVSLYRAMENNKIFHKKLDGKIISIDLPHFTLIAGTTDFHLLPKPLIDRFKLVLNFDFYSEVEIEQIITNRCKKVGWNIEEQVLNQIGKIARGIPRIALKILENTRRVSRAEGSEIITIEHLSKSCQLEGLDKLGLNDNERKLLQILASENKPIGD